VRISVGIDRGTAEFAVRTIRTWWHAVGSKRYRGARDLPRNKKDRAVIP
jgi:hypothetical protein